MTTPRHPWDRRPDESLVEYQRFLCYVSLGPTRSIDGAYRKHWAQHAPGEGGGTRPKVAPGNWQENATRNAWKDRAHQWDVSRIRAYGNRLAVLWVHGVETLAAKALRSVKRFNPGDPAWGDVLDTFKLIASQLTPEGIRAVSETPQRPDESVGGTAPLDKAAVE